MVTAKIAAYHSSASVNLFSPLKISTEEESTKRKKSQKGPMKTKKLKTEKREAKKSVREKFEILSVEVCNTWCSL